MTVFLSCLAGCMAPVQPTRHPETSLEQIRLQIRGTPQAVLTAGAFRVEITPPTGTPLAGYAKRRGRPSVGIRDPLYVRVLALDDGEDTVLLVAADLLAFPYPLAEELIERISREFKIPRQGIVLAATHTHSAGGAIARGFLHEQVFGPYRASVVEGLTGRILWAVRQALDGRQPARWAAASAPAFLGVWVENRAAVGGAADPALSVLLLESVEGRAGEFLPGRPLVVVVSAAAHPTLMDSRDMRLSADFPGELARRIEAAYPGAVCLYLNGAAGDTRPKDAIGATADERIQRFGALLAEGAVGLVNQATPRSSADLAVWGGWVPLPPPQMRLGPIPLHPEIGRRMRPSSAFLHLAALSEVILVPLPGEMTTALGLQLRLELSGRQLKPFLVGYTGGYLGYAVTPQEYGSGSYEASMTWYGPDFGAVLVDRLGQLAGLYSEPAPGVISRTSSEARRTRDLAFKDEISRPPSAGSK